MRLWLVRHPKPLIEQGVCYGASEVPCDPVSVQEAAHLLVKAWPECTRIVSSPLQRCEHLAQALCDLAPNRAYEIEPDLAEMNFGQWELRPWQAIAQSQLAAWTADFAHYRCGSDGESTAQFIQRVAACLLNHWREGEDAVWITHAGVIRALRWLERQPGFLEWFDRATQGRTQIVTIPEILFNELRSEDWPQEAVAYCQVQVWPMQWA